MDTPFADKWATLIGVNDYEFMSKLKFSRQDVMELSKALQDPLGFAPDHILAFHEESSLKPERDNIFIELEKIRASGKVQKEDLLVLYFSGHGISLAGKDYLLPIKAAPRTAKHLGIKVEDLVEELAEFECNNVVLFLDACRENLEGAKGVSTIGLDTQEAVKRAGIVTFFSCDLKDISYEIEELGHSSFTQCLLDAIRTGEKTTVLELYLYLKDQVPKINERHKKPDQHPDAIIHPPEKGALEILFSPKMRQSVRERLMPLSDRLCDLLQEHDPDLWFKFIEFLDKTMGGQRKIGPRENALIGAAEKFTQGSLSSEMLKIVWDNYERQRIAAPQMQRGIAVRGS